MSNPEYGWATPATTMRPCLSCGCMVADNLMSEHNAFHADIREALRG